FREPEQFFTPLQIDRLEHVRQVVEGAKPVIIHNTRTDPRWRRLINNEYILCWMGVPLIARGEVIGLFNLDRAEANGYTKEDTHLALAFANQAATAIDNARLFTTSQRRAEESDALRATLADILAELELPRLLKAILERSISLFRATGGDLGLFQENEQSLKIVSSVNLGYDYTGAQMALGEGLMGSIAKTLEPEIVDDYQHWRGRSGQYSHGRWGGAIGAPMLIGRRLVGVIGIVDENPRRKFKPTDLHLLTMFAQQAAVAVENARLYQAACDAAERRTALHHISQEIIAIGRDTEQIYRAIYQAATRLVPCNAFVISLVDRKQDKILPVFLIDRGRRQTGPVISTKEGLSGHVLAQGKSVYIPDIEAYLSTNEAGVLEPVHFGAPTKIRSALAVPMRVDDDLLGILSAQSYKVNAYTKEDLGLLEMLASYAAIALQNARLFEEVQYMAITDPLTHIANRRQLFDLAQHEFNRAQRFHRQLAFLMVDVDEFKQVNDTYGHPAGDQVLIELTQRLNNDLREIDLLGRYGGEEFMIVLPEAAVEGAHLAAERLRKLIADKPFEVGAERIRITVSIGVAALQPEIKTLGQLIKLADEAAYRAKQSGRNRVAVAGSPPGG
ncbi:MAG TPA: sensor domain-containing diguanylate cyclase, partial [Anaerolineales bacterium]|nr:sensor domain-containing diguanylate cyclase [Anaerolineales bacterium]